LVVLRFKIYRFLFSVVLSHDKILYLFSISTRLCLVIHLVFFLSFFGNFIYVKPKWRLSIVR
jgi:hypothetical protein